MSPWRMAAETGNCRTTQFIVKQSGCKIVQHVKRVCIMLKRQRKGEDVNSCCDFTKKAIFFFH